jgi:ABC-type transporter lipoprotein component MlaA
MSSVGPWVIAAWVPRRLYHVPFFGASTVRGTVAYAADSAMWPVPYFVPWYVSISTGAGKAVTSSGFRCDDAPRHA